MEKVKDNDKGILKELLQIKKLIALMTTLVFCILSVFTLVIGFYFGQSSARQAMKESK